MTAHVSAKALMGAEKVVTNFFRKRLKTERLLHVDFETFSEADIKKCGAHVYAMHPSTEVLCMAWAFDDDEPQLWLPWEPFPTEILDHILDEGLILAWNAQFERLIFTHVLSRTHNVPVPAYECFVCVMVMGMAMSLPGHLEKAAPAVGLEIRKDDVGHRIMLQLSRPRKPTIKDKRTRWTPEMAPFKFQQLYDYCKQDVRVETAIFKRLVALNDIEQARYWLDQKIQDRGCFLDLVLIKNALEIADETTERLNSEMRELTGNEVASTSAAKQLVAWLSASGIEWPKPDHPSIDKENLLKLIARDDLTNSQRTAIMLRQEAAKTSTAKLDRALMQVCPDGSVKGQIQFNGAGTTGRDAGRGIQVQNFPRPEKAYKNTEAIIKDIVAGMDADWIGCLYGPPLSVIASILRGIIVARPGKKLMTLDLSQIEARMTAWLAGEERLVQAFREYDAGTGPDIYIVTAAGVYAVPVDDIDKEDPRRQVGKVCVLALGFGGGASAFGGMAKIYQVDLDPLYPIVANMAGPERLEAAIEGWKARGKKSGMHKAAWLAAEMIKIMWRESNSEIVAAWKELEDGAVTAMMRPGDTISCLKGKVQYRKTGSWLRCILPSGRSIFYAFPTLVEQETPWGRSKMVVRYKAQNGLTHQWQDFYLYGGIQFQNVVQAAARDVFWEGIDRCEEAGYENIFRVHDEGIFEVDEDFGDEQEFHDLFTQASWWAPDLPIASDGWVGGRYRKG